MHQTNNQRQQLTAYTAHQLAQKNQVLLQQIKVLEEALEVNEIYVQALAQATTDGILIYEEENILLANDATYLLFDYEKGALTGQKISTLIAPKQQKEVEEWSSEQKIGSIETIGQRNGTGEVAIKVSQKQLFLSNKKVNIWVVQDLTQQKKMERQLAESTRRYQQLFEETNDAVYFSSLTGTLLMVNDAMLRLFGYSREEMLQMNAARLYANPTDRMEFKMLIEQTGSVSEYEVQLKRKNGETLDCLFSTGLSKNEFGEVIGYQGIIRDITKQKRTLKLIKEKELAERSARMKAAFLANMSHEIRTPMNAVVGMLHLLKETKLYPTQLKYVEGIQQATKHLLVLINDILDFSKIEAGKLTIEQMPFDLQHLLTNVLATFKFKAAKSKVSLLLHIEDDLPLQLIGDATRLTQILLNLVGNALKFTASGSIKVSVRLLEENEQTATLAFSIKDTGIGISAEKVNTIFDAFAQATNHSTQKLAGTGLGLAITKRLVEIQGGSISVTSELGKGTEFHFVIRYKKQEQTDKETPILQQQDAIKFEPLPPLKILLVEDNLLNQVVAEDTIKKWGDAIEITTVENGKLAIDQLQQNTFDLVLMDVQMPEMNGYEATKYIRYQLQLTDLPILAMTAYATTGEAEKTIAAGMTDYISKPFNPKVLYQKIQKLTDKQRKTPMVTTVKLTNLAYLEEATMGDTALKKKLISLMIQETPIDVANMEAACSQQNWKQLARLAHKFKSAALFMGIPNLQTLVEQTQVAAEKETDLEALPFWVEEIKRLATLACEELQE